MKRFLSFIIIAPFVVGTLLGQPSKVLRLIDLNADGKQDTLMCRSTSSNCVLTHLVWGRENQDLSDDSISANNDSTLQPDASTQLIYEGVTVLKVSYLRVHLNQDTLPDLLIAVRCETKPAEGDTTKPKRIKCLLGLLAQVGLDSLSSIHFRCDSGETNSGCTILEYAEGSGVEVVQKNREGLSLERVSRQNVDVGTNDTVFPKEHLAPSEVQSSRDKLTVSAAPIPSVDGIVHIRCSRRLTMGTVDVFSMDGQCMLRRSIEGGQPTDAVIVLNLLPLPPGVYMARVAHQVSVATVYIIRGY